MNRRALIAAGLAFVGLGLLTACPVMTLRQDLDRLAIASGEIDVALRSMVPELVHVSGMSPAAVAKIVFMVDNVADLARQIAAAADLNSAKPPAQQLVVYVNLIIAELEKFPLPDKMRKILDTVQFALPIIIGIIQGA